MPRLGGHLDIAQVSADPTTPPSGRQHLYVKSDGHVYTKRPDGTVVLISPDMATYVTTNTEQTITGTKTFNTVPNVPNNAWTVAKINATGTRDATTYLRGDGTWSTPAGGGGGGGTLASVTAAYTVATGVQYVLAGGTTAYTVTLPAHASARAVEVKRTGTADITIAPGSGTIDGAASFLLNVQYEAVTLVSDGTNWFIF